MRKLTKGIFKKEKRMMIDRKKENKLSNNYKKREAWRKSRENCLKWVRTEINNNRDRNKL